MKYLCLFLLLTGLSAAAQTNAPETNAPPFCCRYPYRVLGVGQVVDLTPLITWWIHQGPALAALPLNAARPPRPLSAWKRILGVKTAELDSAWVVQAEISLSPTEKTNEWIILKNPPAAEASQYYNLQYLIPQYEQQIAADRRKQDELTKTAAHNTALAKRLADNYSKSIRWNAPYYTQLADQNKAAAAAALADQQATQQSLDQARKQLKLIPSVDGQYQIDLFALGLGRNARGRMIYDAGAVYGAAP